MSDKETPTTAPALEKKDENKNKDKKDEKDESTEDTTKRIAVVPKEVVVHPLVLLSVVDHYNRVAKDTKKRVVGILLGETHKGKVDVTNSYAVPFEEDQKESNIWFLDHNYHENMFAMFKKVNAKERVIGWYSTGPKIRPSDLEINELIRKYCSNPVLVIVDVNPKDALEIPTEAYLAVENIPEQQKESRRTFVHLPCEIGAYEAEEVGVEHLLRDIRNTTESTLTDQVNAKVTSLLGLKKRMEEMHSYLSDVVEGKLPVNHQILYNMQNIFNLSPNLKQEDIVKSFAIKTNDNHLVIYLSSLVRSVISLHNLINNKMENKRAEQQEADNEQKLKEAKKKESTKKDDANEPPNPPEGDKKSDDKLNESPATDPKTPPDSKESS